MTLREFITEAAGEEKISAKLEKKLGDDKFSDLVDAADRFAGPLQIRRAKEEGESLEDVIDKNLERFKEKASKVLSDEEASKFGGWRRIFVVMAKTL